MQRRHFITKQSIQEVWNQNVKLKDDVDCNLLHLKTAKFSEFADPIFEGETMLARALLKRAPILEEMLVKIRSREINYYVKIGQTLLTYPRSSGKAAIRFS